MLGLVLITIGVSSIGGDAGLTLLLGLGGFYLISRQFNRSAGAPPERRREGQPSRRSSIYDEEDIRVDASRRSDPPSAMPLEGIYSHAARAARAAGIEPSEALVLPVDIGVMAFHPQADPEIHRSLPVADDAEYLQPYIQLRLPRRAEGRIRFEVLDADGQQVFVHDDRYPLKAGDNLISPQARLRLDPSQAKVGAWELRVSADGVALAIHRIAWQPNATEAIRRHVVEDGEISPELRALIAENRLGRMSLDELLSDQPPLDDEQKRQRGGG